MTLLPAVLALVPDAFGGRGGIAQYNRDFLGTLAATGSVSSITILPRHTPDRSSPPEGISQLPQRRGRIRYSIEAFRIATLREVDIVFCGHLYMAPLAAIIARLKGAKLIIQTHGIEAWPRPRRHQRRAVEGADLVLCVSRHTRATLLGWAAMPPERVLVVPNTVREVFTPGDASALRATMGLEGKRVLITVGRMDTSQRYKGQDRVIEALPNLCAMGHDVCYLVIGEGDDRQRLEALASSVGVSDRVRFFGGVGLQQLVDICRMADLLVMPSTGEGFGIAFLEAMACGTPALGLDVAGAKDALADGQLGTIVPEFDLITAMARLIKEPKLDPLHLARAVRDRFGRAMFTASVDTAVRRLMEAA